MMIQAPVYTKPTLDQAKKDDYEEKEIWNSPHKRGLTRFSRNFQYILRSTNSATKRRNIIAPNFRMADTSPDDDWSIIYDQIIGVESIYGIGLGPLSPWKPVFATAVSPCFHHTNMHASAIFPPQ